MNKIDTILFSSLKKILQDLEDKNKRLRIYMNNYDLNAVVDSIDIETPDYEVREIIKTTLESVNADIKVEDPKTALIALDELLYALNEVVTNILIFGQKAPTFRQKQNFIRYNELILEMFRAAEAVINGVKRLKIDTKYKKLPNIARINIENVRPKEHINFTEDFNLIIPYYLVVFNYIFALVGFTEVYKDKLNENKENRVMEENKIISGVDYNYVINPDNENEEFLYEIIIGLIDDNDEWRDAIVMPVYETYRESIKGNYDIKKMFKDIKDILNEEFKEDFKVDDVFDWCGNLGCWFMVDYHNVEETEYFRDEVPIADVDITDSFYIEDIKEMFKESKMTKEQILKEIEVVKEIEKEEGTLSKNLRFNTFYNMLLYYREKGIEPKDVAEDDLLYYYDYVNFYTERSANPNK